MGFIMKLARYVKDEQYRLAVNVDRGLYRFATDEKFLRAKFKAKIGRDLDLNNPKTYNEKLQWLKLHDRKQQYTTMVDKYEVKRYVSEIIGNEYIIPTFGVWERFDDIDFNLLPNQFVIKCTHDSGGLCIVKDKNKFDIDKARKKINKSLKRNYYSVSREWPYKNVKPRIIVEQYMEDEIDHPLRDYKIYTFNGNAKICMINQDRKIHTRADYFNEKYEWLDFIWGYDHADKRPEKPLNYGLMFELAEKLAKGTATLRVDFYEVRGKLYFGELTFYDGGGFDIIDPIEWDYKLGNMVTLPNSNEE